MKAAHTPGSRTRHPAQRLAFIVYVNRSGSTYFASLLDAIPNVRVSIESDFVARLIEHAGGGDRTLAAGEAYDVMASDPQFAHWKITRTDFLAGVSGGTDAPLGLRAILDVVFDLAFGHSDKILRVCKLPRLGQHIPALKALYPGATFLHTVRDVRAVVNSQMHARSIKFGLNLPMAPDPELAARQWAEDVERAALDGGRDLVTIRYEDLIANPAATMTGVCRTLSARSGLPVVWHMPSSRDRAAHSYFDRIPADQQGLHGHVAGGAPVTGRANAWMKELSSLDLHLIQLGAARTMARLGYHLVPIGPRAVPYFRVLRRRLHYRLQTWKLRLRRLPHYLRDPVALMARLRARRHEQAARRDLYRNLADRRSI